MFWVIGGGPSHQVRRKPSPIPNSGAAFACPAVIRSPVHPGLPGMCVWECRPSPQAGLFVYWTVALTFGRDASVARSACHFSYSGVPRRGGASDGNPPIACGMSAIGLLPAVVHPESNAAASSRRANLILASRGTLQRTRVLINRLTSGSTTRVMKKKTTPTSENISAVAIADTPNKKQLDAQFK